jgi:hypothetical protein
MPAYRLQEGDTLYKMFGPHYNSVNGGNPPVYCNSIGTPTGITLDANDLRCNIGGIGPIYYVKADSIETDYPNRGEGYYGMSACDEGISAAPPSTAGFTHAIDAPGATLHDLAETYGPGIGDYWRWGFLEGANNAMSGSGKISQGNYGQHYLYYKAGSSPTYQYIYPAH